MDIPYQKEEEFIAISRIEELMNRYEKQLFELFEAINECNLEEQKILGVSHE